MTDLQQYAALLEPYLAPGFAFHEIVRFGSRTKGIPPHSMWRSMIRPLQFANELRAVMVEKHGAKGLRVNAAYRPNGGAARSMHKRNRALDLDLLPGDYGLTHVYYDEAVTLWCKYGHDEALGLGIYCPKDACNGIRIHIDAGGYAKSRHWQHGSRPGIADQLIIAKRLGLHVPGHDAPVDDEGSDDDGDDDA